MLQCYGNLWIQRPYCYRDTSPPTCNSIGNINKTRLRDIIKLLVQFNVGKKKLV